jgi:hypothetical protein
MSYIFEGHVLSDHVEISCRSREVVLEGYGTKGVFSLRFHGGGAGFFGVRIELRVPRERYDRFARFEGYDHRVNSDFVGHVIARRFDTEIQLNDSEHGRAFSYYFVPW